MVGKGAVRVFLFDDRMEEAGKRRPKHSRACQNGAANVDSEGERYVAVQVCLLDL